MSKILYTEAASELCGRQDPSRGPVDGVETYYNESGDELNVTTDGREAFESDTGHDLTQDVLNDGQWSEFIEYLGLNKAEEAATKPGAYTPGPWQVIENGGRITIENDAVEIAEVVTENVDNLAHARTDAALIVRAVNSHDELVKALEGAQAVIRQALPHLPADKEAVFAGEWLDEINAALAKVKGQS